MKLLEILEDVETTRPTARPRLRRRKNCAQNQMRTSQSVAISDYIGRLQRFRFSAADEIIAGGELEYQRNCAVCHGVEGRGDGIMRKYLTVGPANLRQLAKNNGGKFPFWDVYHKIDGQTEVRAHGTREMPIWGDRFRAEAGNDGKSALTQAAGRILSLVFYLEHIQE